MTSMTIRDMTTGDLAPLASIVDDTGLFPPEMLPELVQPFLAGEEDCHWLLAEKDGVVLGFAYAKAEPLAEGCWNMLALGVAGANRRRGLAARLVAALEARLAEAGARLMIVDTSGADEFDAARRFYAAQGYAHEALIRDFWADGDDKITFRKVLK